MFRVSSRYMVRFLRRGYLLAIAQGNCHGSRGYLRFGFIPERDSGESDSPCHCASGGECLEGISLADYGLIGKRRWYFPFSRKGPKLYGAESVTVGAILSGLTDYGADYLAEMLAEDNPTPYQSALFELWREEFADYLS